MNNYEFKIASKYLCRVPCKRQVVASIAFIYAAYGADLIVSEHVQKEPLFLKMAGIIIEDMQDVTEGAVHGRETLSLDF